jgi:hypothetical protein
MRKGKLFNLAKDCYRKPLNTPDSQSKLQPAAASVLVKHFDRGVPLALAYDEAVHPVAVPGEAISREPESHAGSLGAFWSEPFETVPAPQQEQAPASPNPAPEYEQPKPPAPPPKQEAYTAPALAPAQQPVDRAETPELPATPGAGQVKPEKTGTAKKEKTTLGDEEFMSDLRAILRGDKAFDEEKKEMVPRQDYAAPKSTPAPTPPPQTEEEPVAFKPSEHAIFDKIAQNMRFANAYDLGAFTMEQRFDQFDKTAAAEEKFADLKKQKPEPPASKPGGQGKEKTETDGVTTSDFLNDLDKIKASQQKEPAEKPGEQEAGNKEESGKTEPYETGAPAENSEG